jgi:hypothetical protein
MFRCRIWIVLVLASCPGIAMGQDRIQQIRDDANTPSTPPAPDNSGANGRKNSQDNDPNCQSDDLAGSALILLGVVVASPFALPYLALHDDFKQSADFLAYPYAHDYPGYLWRSSCWPDEQEDGVDFGHPPHIQPWSVRFSAEDGNDFDGMNRVGLRFALDTTWRVGFQANWNYLSENFNGGLRDQTWLGDTAVTFRFAQNEWINFYTGLGARVLTDPHTTDWGFNFLYGFDSFPKKPWIVSALFDTGNVGSAWIWHGRGTIGASYKHLEVFTGYDFMRVGSVNVQGPLVGLRLWF